MNIANVPKIYDIAYQGTAGGALAEMWNKEALMNSLRIWMASFAGETMHDPSRGGYLMQFLMKPMIEVDIEHMKDTIRVGLTTDFKPNIQVNYIQVIPNYKERYWQIVVSVFSPDLKESIEMNEKLKSAQ